MKLNRLRPGRVARLLGVSAAAGALALAWALPAQAAPSPVSTCTGGVLAGSYTNLVVTGPCTVAGEVTVNGSLTIAGQGAAFASEYPGSPAVKINGNVFVSHGGMLALGQPVEGCGNDVRATSVIKGNVVARGALSVKILCSTVRGSIISTGGGYSAHPDCLTAGGTNLPIKDNTVSGSIFVNGWSGCWMGVIRNQVGGTVILTGNRAVAYEPGTTNPDGMEIVTNHISGSLICFSNSPRPQVGDSQGEANQVAGYEVGQCASIS